MFIRLDLHQLAGRAAMPAREEALFEGFTPADFENCNKADNESDAKFKEKSRNAHYRLADFGDAFLGRYPEYGEPTFQTKQSVWWYGQGPADIHYIRFVDRRFVFRNRLNESIQLQTVLHYDRFNVMIWIDNGATKMFKMARDNIKSNSADFVGFMKNFGPLLILQVERPTGQGKEVELLFNEVCLEMTTGHCEQLLTAMDNKGAALFIGVSLSKITAIKMKSAIVPFVRETFERLNPVYRFLNGATNPKADGASRDKPPEEKGSYHMSDENYYPRRSETADTALGLAGEMFVLEEEKKKLRKAKRTDLVKKVMYVGNTNAHYDILSFTTDGEPMYIEVKTTRSHRDSRFYVTRKERDLAKLKGSSYFLYRVHSFDDKERRGIDVVGGEELEDRLDFEPVTYEVRYK